MSGPRHVFDQFRKNSSDSHVLNLSHSDSGSHVRYKDIKENLEKTSDPIIGAADLNKLVQTFKEKSPTELMLDSTNYTLSDFKALAALIQSAPKRLRAVFLKNRKTHQSPINEQTMSILMDALCANSHIETFSFEGHSLDEKAASHLASRLNATELRICDLTDCRLNAFSILLLIKAIAKSKLTKLIMVDESENVIPFELGDLLLSVIRENLSLMELHLPKDTSFDHRDATSQEDDLRDKIMEVTEILSLRRHFADKIIRAADKLHLMLLPVGEIKLLQQGGREIVRQTMLDDYAEIPIEGRPTREVQEIEIANLLGAIDKLIASSYQAKMFQSGATTIPPKDELPHSPRSPVTKA